MELAKWRFPAVKQSLPPVQVVNVHRLEVHDWREYAYAGGALRVYVNRDGDDVIAVLADTTRPPYDGLKQLRPSNRRDVRAIGRWAIAIPIEPIDRKLFDVLKSKSWTKADLRKRLGPPSYSFHVHGSGQTFLEHVRQGLTFVDGDPDAPNPDDWYYLANPAADYDEYGQPQHSRDLGYETYEQYLHQRSGFLAETIARNMQLITEALAKGKSSPHGRFVAAYVNVGDSYNNGQTAIRERGKPERLYPSPESPEDYSWVDDRTLTYCGNWGGEVCHLIDAVTGRKSQRDPRDRAAGRCVRCARPAL